MSGLDPRIFARMVKEAGLVQSYGKMIERAGEAVNPAWKTLADASKYIGTYGGRIHPDDWVMKGVGGLGRAAAGSAVGAGVGALADSEDRKRGALRGAVIGGAGAAAVPMALKGVHDVGKGTAKFVTRPFHTLREGWESMGRTYTPKQLAKSEHLRERGAEQTKTLKEKLEKGPGFFKRLFGATPESQQANVSHLISPTGEAVAPKGFGEAYRGATGQGVFGGRVKAVAEEASRRGWTGQGRITKYMPVGQKGFTAAFTGLSAPVVYRAATGEEPWHEAAGDIAANLGFVAGSAVPGMGMAGSMAMSELVRRGLAAPVRWAEGARHQVQVPDAWSQQAEQVGIPVQEVSDNLHGRNSLATMNMQDRRRQWLEQHPELAKQYGVTQ